MEPDVTLGLVTVVMPAYERAGIIAAAVASVLAQTYRELELLVVDDGSTDGTAEVVEGFALHDARVRLIRLKVNEGRSAARNHALDAAKGEFVTFLDSDDLYAPQRLEGLVAAARRFPGDDIFIDDNLQFAFRDQRVVLRNRSVYPTGVLPGRARPVWVEGYVRWSAASKLFLRRTLVQHLGLRFPTDLAQAEDYVLLLRALFEGRSRRVIRVPRSLYWYRRPYESQRETGWYINSGIVALERARGLVVNRDLDEMAPRLRRYMQHNPDDGSPNRFLDPRRYTRNRLIFTWCYVWARLLDAPLRRGLRRGVEQALELGAIAPDRQ